MTPFEILLVAHLVGDMIIAQTAYEAHNKVGFWWPCITHAAKWTAVMGVAGYLAGWRWETPFFVALLLMGVAHAIIDRRWPVTGLMRVVKGERTPPDWLVMWVDQILHVVQVAVLALFLK